MTKDELRSGVASIATELDRLHDEATKLQNQNLANIIDYARGSLRQVGEHPDFRGVARNVYGDEGTENVNPVAAGTDPAVQTNPLPFPGSVVGGPDRGAAGTYVPGDPKFDPNANNPNFQQPAAVDLNVDGTLKQAPNSLGE